MSSSLYCGPVQVVVHANARVVEVAPRLGRKRVLAEVEVVAVVWKVPSLVRDDLVHPHARVALAAMEEHQVERQHPRLARSRDRAGNECRGTDRSPALRAPRVGRDRAARTPRAPCAARERRRRRSRRRCAACALDEANNATARSTRAARRAMNVETMTRNLPKPMCSSLQHSRSAASRARGCFRHA